MLKWKIKVHQSRKQTFLLGGLGNKDLYEGDTGELFFKNDDLGEVCIFGVRNVAGMIEAGKLEPGECWLMDLRDKYGVWVKCEDPQVDTVIECMIHPRS